MSPMGMHRALTNRASTLRERAATMHPLVAQAYERRAAELELEAFVLNPEAPSPSERPDLAA